MLRYISTYEDLLILKIRKLINISNFIFLKCDTTKNEIFTKSLKMTK